MKTYLFRCQINAGHAATSRAEEHDIDTPDDASAIEAAKALLARLPAGQTAQLLSPDGRMIWMDESGLD